MKLRFDNCCLAFLMGDNFPMIIVIFPPVKPSIDLRDLIAHLCVHTKRE